MPIRFAHIGDVHLGAFRDPVLRELNLRAFLRCLDVAREGGAAFLVIAGDLFDTNLPDMSVVERAAAGLRALKDAGVPIYAFYGSHDRSPTERGIVDVLASAGLFQNVGVQGPEGDGEGGVQPSVSVHAPTGAALTAVGGRRLGLESKVLEAMDAGALARHVQEAPLAVFGYHGAVEGMLPPELGMLEALPPSKLPRGFHYYALGHIHAHRVKRFPGGALAVYPGPTFGAGFTDLFDEGPKGIVIVDAGPDGRCEARQVRVEVAPIDRVDVGVDGMAAEAAREKVKAAVEGMDVPGHVVLLRVRGALSSGRPADLELPAMRQAMLDRGALVVFLNRAGLTEVEREGGEGAGAGAGGGAGGDPREVASRVLLGHIERHQSPLPWLRGEGGCAVALALLDVLKQERGESRRDDHADKVVRESFSVLDVEGRAKEAARAGDGEWTSDGQSPDGEARRDQRGDGRTQGPSGLDKWLGGGGK